MSDVVVTVIGAGIIGTSLGLALKEVEDAPKLIVHDKKSEHSRQAMKMKAFDKSEWNLISACEGADLIILAIPATEIKATLEAIAPYLKEDVVISDTSPIKSKLISMAKSILPDHAHFIGGNPILSTVNTGPTNGRADLFHGMLYCLTPTSSLVPEAVSLLENMVKLIGATPFFLDPVEHDGLLSAVNGLPTLLSVALVNAVSKPTSWVETRKLAGGLFSQVSAGAIGDPDSLAEELLNNKENILRWLNAFTDSLQTAKNIIEADENEALAQYIDEAVVNRTNWQTDFEQNQLSQLQGPAQEIEKPNIFKQLFGFGNR